MIIMQTKRFSLIILLVLCATVGFSQEDRYDIMCQRLDSLVQVGIDSMAFPGAQILVRHRDSIIFHKTWGHHTYENDRQVEKEDIYDLASVTKVSSGLPLLMKLYGQGSLNLDAPLRDYYKCFRRSNKKNLTLRQVLAHQARLKPYIVFWQEAKKGNGDYRRRTFKTNYSKKYPIRITDSLFMHKRYHKKMHKAIKKSELRGKKEYVYSGLAFLLMPDMIEDVTGKKFESYLQDEIYQPIGADKLTYNPTKKFSVDEIVPTENDTLWRYQLVHGTVHDEAAAMLDGISCNAGLFGSAESLSRLFQLYLNKGSWDGRQIISEHAVEMFTAYQYNDNRRGLGFDKPLREYDADLAYVAESSSPSSFGHSGFTGTMVWADPEHELVYVFLSNRVYPYRSHRNLYRMSLRPALHQVVYDYVSSLSFDL